MTNIFVQNQNKKDVFVRRFMEDFLTRVRDHLFRGGAPLRDEFFDFLATLPNQVNSSSIGCAKMMHNGKTFVRKLEALEKQNAKRAREAEAANAGETEGEEEEEDEAKPTSALFLAPEFSDLLGSKKLLIWSDGEVTADTEEEKTRKSTTPLPDALQKISEACKKMDKEFDKDEWEMNTGSEIWRGFFVYCPESEGAAGEAMARKVLQVQDVADEMEGTSLMSFPQYISFRKTDFSCSSHEGNARFSPNIVSSKVLLLWSCVKVWFSPRQTSFELDKSTSQKELAC